MSNLKIVATLIIKEEYREELLSALNTVVNETRKEEGNISYHLYQDTKEPLKYIFIEEWKDNKAIALHNDSPHFQQFAKAIDGKIESLDINIAKLVY